MFVVGAAREQAFDHVLDHVVVELGEPILPELGPDLRELVHGHWRRGAAHAAAEVDLGVLGPVLCGGGGGEWRALSSRPSLCDQAVTRR